MNRTPPQALLDGGQVKAKATRRAYAPRFRTEPTPEEVARTRDLFNQLSPRGQAAAIRFIEMLAKDEAGLKAAAK